MRERREKQPERKLTVHTAYGKVLPTETVRIDIQGEGEVHSLVVQYLISHGVVIVEMVYPDRSRSQLENIVVDENMWRKMSDMIA